MSLFHNRPRSTGYPIVQARVVLGLCGVAVDEMLVCMWLSCSPPRSRATWVFSACRRFGDEVMGRSWGTSHASVMPPSFPSPVPYLRHRCVRVQARPLAPPIELAALDGSPWVARPRPPAHALPPPPPPSPRTPTTALHSAALSKRPTAVPHCCTCPRCHLLASPSSSRGPMGDHHPPLPTCPSSSAV